MYKKPSHEDHMSLDKIEDLFWGYTPMLSYLAEDLAHKGKKNEALGICIRHNLIEVIRPDTREILEDTVYEPKKEPVVIDRFGPGGEGDFISLPSEVRVEWVGTLEDINKLDALLTEPFIGVDSEWRPSLAKFHNTKPALF